MNENCFVKQTSINDCGVACLLMILKSYGIDETLNSLKQKMKIKENGVSAYEIVKTAKKYNLVCTGYKSININNLTLPAIVHTTNKEGMGHYMVLLKVLKTKVLIADPLNKIMYIEKKEFLKTYSDIALTFDENNSYFKAIFKNKVLIIRLLIYTLLLALLSLLFSYSISFVINKNGLNSNLYMIGIIYFLFIGIFKSVISYARNIYSIQFRSIIDRLITIPTIKHFFDLPYNYYHENGSGATLSKINDLTFVKEMIYKFVEVVSVNFIVILFSLVIISIYNLKLILLNVIYFLIILLINKQYLKYHSFDFLNLQVYNQNLNNKVIDSFNSILSIKSLKKEDYFKNKLSKTYSNYVGEYENSFKAYLKKELFISIVTTLLIITYLIFLFDSNLSVSNLLFLYICENLILESLHDIFLLQPLYANFKSVIARLKKTRKKTPIKIDKQIDINSIKFKNLCFKYENKFVLKNISFDIKKGDFLLVTGKIGCGKTTLFKLLSRQINKLGNKIYINNKKIDNLDDDIIRNSILYVDQKSGLLNASIEENIFMGDEMDNSILKSALIDKKMSLDYMIDNTNSNLSNGQISKILIARALNSYKNVIILDEVTSSLDYDTERKILLNIKKNYKDKTLIIINHRNENKDIFNKIINLDKISDNKKYERTAV